MSKSLLLGIERTFIAVFSIFSGFPSESSSLRLRKTSIFIFTRMACRLEWNTAEILPRFLTDILPFPSVHPVATCIPSTTQDKGGLLPVSTITDRSLNPFDLRVLFANRPFERRSLGTDPDGRETPLPYLLHPLALCLHFVQTWRIALCNLYECLGIAILTLRALPRISPNTPPIIPPTACFAENEMTAQIGLRLIKKPPIIKPATPAHAVENETILRVLGRGFSKQLL